VACAFDPASLRRSSDRAALRIAVIGAVEEQLNLAELDQLGILVHRCVEHVAPEPAAAARLDEG
jgi:hypothetical protein